MPDTKNLKTNFGATESGAVPTHRQQKDSVGDEEKEEESSEEDESEESDESLDEVIEGEGIAVPRRAEGISESPEEFGDSFDSSDFENFISSPSDTSVTQPARQRRIQQQDMLEEVADVEGLRQTERESEQNAERDYSTGYNLAEYEANLERQEEASEGFFIPRNLKTENTERFNPVRRDPIVLDKELEELRAQQRNKDSEKDYSAELKTIEREEKRLPFQRGLTKYKI